MIKFSLFQEKFGLWTVIEQTERRITDKFLCQCQCGEQRRVLGSNLKNRRSRGCGCNRRHRTTHGHGRRNQKTATYRAWKAMHSRVKPAYKQASDYFERGIKVCDRWSQYENFLADMGERPEGRTLDRIDNDGNYTPSNCRWADAKTQRRNCRRTSWVIYQGRTMTVQDAAEIIGVHPSAIWNDKRRNGVSIQDAVDRVAKRKAA